MTDPHVLLKAATDMLALGRLDDAARLAEQLLRQQPQSATAHHLAGIIRLKQGKDARAPLAAARQLDPRSSSVARHHGQALEQAHQPAAALAAYDASLVLNARDAEAWCLRSNALLDLARPQEALESCDRALALVPHHTGALTNRGAALKALGRLEDAIASFDRALALAPQDAAARLGRGLARLLVRDFQGGWPDYEYRHAPRMTPQLSFAGKALLLTAEQGLGDTLQFSRYAQLAQAMGARVTLAPQPVLLPLLQGLTPAVPLWDGQGAVPAHDLAIPLPSMPLAMGIDAPVAQTPYMAADPTRVEYWHSRLGNGFRIGLGWQGDIGRIDIGRSIPLSCFLPLAALPSVQLFSLQKNYGTEQINNLPQLQSLPGLDADGAFVDSAAIMTSLDLIITSDTALAHLAGALGRPVWLLLQHVPDWRWSMTGTGTPWYPSMRIFRQETPGDWPGVLTAVVKAAREIQPG